MSTRRMFPPITKQDVFAARQYVKGFKDGFAACDRGESYADNAERLDADMSEVRKAAKEYTSQITESPLNRLSDCDELHAKSQWQPIETAPLDWAHPHYFLVFTSNGNTLMGVALDGELCYLTLIDGFTNLPGVYGVITHWMPLPDAPDQQGGEA